MSGVVQTDDLATMCQSGERRALTLKSCRPHVGRVGK